MHALCLVIQGIKRYLNIELPHRLELCPGGFIIYHSQPNRVKNTSNFHKLYLHSPLSVATKTKLDAHHKQDFLENALFLLDENIKFLNYISGESQLIGAKLCTEAELSGLLGRSEGS